MSNWKKVKLKELTKKIGSGATPTGGKKSYINNGISLIRSLNVFDFEFKKENLAFINKEQAKKLSNVIAEENDILLNITGASVARCCVVPKNILPARVNQHVSIIRVNKQKASSVYIFYYLVSPINKNRLLNISHGGATREALTKEIIENFYIDLPCIFTQQKIASILSAYDNLIEINNRRIKILEGMAQFIYKEWFVKFKFLGYKKVKIKNGVPEGWEEKEIQIVTDIQSGYAFKRSNFNKNGEWGIVTIKNVQDGYFITDCTDRISEIPKNMSGKCYLNSGDILISLTGNIGRVCLVYGDDSLLNQRVAKLIPTKPIYYPFVYTLFRNKDFQKKLEMLANGVAQQNLSPVETKYIKVKIPKDELLKSFYKKVNPMLKMIVKLYLINKNLRETRDMLLPKLMSGEIEVKY